MGSQNSRQAFQTLMRFTLVTVLLLFLTVPVLKAETNYSNYNSHYPDSFCNNIFNTVSNDMQHMDAVEFGGKTIVFFTLFSSCSLSYNSYLYYWYDSDHAYKLDIGNSTGNQYIIKTAVFKDVLYIFYTSPYWTTIRYRTATLDTGPAGTDWTLEFTGEKRITAGPTTTLRMARWMNDALYVIYSSGSDWYYVSSTDGTAFDSPARFFTGGPIKGAGGAVFQVPDPTEASVEKMMISYATGSGLKYFFFDGIYTIGPYTAPVAANTSPYSVRLIAGSATDYSNSRYAIQVFYASPQDNEDQDWNSIYHREYFPAGGDGELGEWSPQWTRLTLDNDDRIHSINAYESDPSWAVVAHFQNDPPDVRMLIHLWYFRNRNYVWPSMDRIRFRRSTYESDLLVHTNTSSVSPGKQDLSTSTVLGVIEGTPPFPENGGMPVNDSTYAVSNLSFNVNKTADTRTAWSAGGSILVSCGQTFLKKGSWSTKLSAALKYTQETRTQSESATSLGFSSWGDVPPGDLGWVMVLTPEIINDEYILKAWDGHCLGYGTDVCGDEFRTSLITYGEETTVQFYAYYLTEPSDPFGDDTYPEIFNGMALRNVSTDLVYWSTELDTTNPFYSVYLNDDAANPLPHLSSTIGESVADTEKAATSEAQTWSPSAGFTASAQKLGFISFGTEASANFSMDIQTTTTMSGSLGFSYHLPKCPQPIDYCCYGQVGVQPWLLIPNEDDSGYNAYWISDDIRNNRKPKPWCLTYVAEPDHECSLSLSTSRLAVENAQGTLFFDLGAWDRDQIKAHFTLEGITPDFFLAGDEPLRIWFGSYPISTEKNYVINRYFRGRHLIIELSEEEHPESFITARLSYDTVKSKLDVHLDADGINLSSLFAYPFLSGEENSRRTTGTLPFILNIGGQYYSSEELDMDCAFNNKNGKCSF